MSRTLFWYIFKDLLKIFLTTSLVLTGIMSFGGLLRRLTEHGLGAGQVMTMLAYVWPAMSTYSLPVAALFATTMVYGRLGADNEITACRAAGISALSVATPAIVLGGVVTVISIVFLFYIVPFFTLAVEKVVYTNIAQVVQNQIERNHRIELDQPGGRPLTIFAQSARVLPAPANRPRDQVVQLTAPVFVRYEQGEHQLRGKPVPPLDFYMARLATAYISQDQSTGDLLMQAKLEGGLKLPRRTVGAKDQALQMTVESFGVYPDPIESPLRENTKFMSWNRLRHLLIEPEKSKRMRSLLTRFVRDDQQAAFLKRLADALNNPPYEVQLGEGGERYVLQRGGASIDVRPDKLVFNTAARVASTALSTSPAESLPALRQLSAAGQTTLEATAHQITVRAAPLVVSTTDPENPKHYRLRIEMDLDDALVTAGNTTTPRRVFPRDFTVAMPPDLILLEYKRIEDYNRAGDIAIAENLDPNSQFMQLRRNFTKLRNSIISEMHARASFSVSCMILVLVGCALGMMFRSGNFLSAFAISVIPAMLSILLIITGQHTCENVPWDIRGYNNPLAFGVYMIWTGNVVVSILAIVLLGRLQRQ